MSDFVRLDIGFDGGPALSVRVDGDGYSKLRKALEKGESWHELKTQDSDLTLDLNKVVYVRLDTEEHRVGF